MPGNMPMFFQPVPPSLYLLVTADFSWRKNQMPPSKVCSWTKMNEHLQWGRAAIDFLEEGNCLIWISPNLLLIHLFPPHHSDQQNCPTSWAAQNDMLCFVCLCVLWYYSRKWEFQVFLDVWFSKHYCNVSSRSPCLLIRDAYLDLYIFLTYPLCWRSQNRDPEERKALIFLGKHIFLKTILGTKVFFVALIKRTRRINRTLF